MWKETITRRFEAAAESYDEAAGAQRRIALELARCLLARPLPRSPTVLEIGCGTGFLTEALQPRLPHCQWLATDLSPRMLELCARRVGPAVTTRVLDGEFPGRLERSFDVVVSSLAVQWFGDLVAGLRRLHALLHPGGVLAVTTLGARTFHEWRELCLAAGVEPATPPYPSAPYLARALGAGAAVEQRLWKIPCGDVMGFLAHLRHTGARTGAPGRSPLPPSVLRRLIRSWQGRPFAVSYDVLTVLWRRD